MHYRSGKIPGRFLFIIKKGRCLKLGVRVIAYEKDGEIIIPQSRVPDLEAMGVALSLDLYGFEEKDGITESFWVLPADIKLDNDLRGIIRIVPIGDKKIFRDWRKMEGAAARTAAFLE